MISFGIHALAKPRVVHIPYSFETGGMEHVIATVINGTCASFEHVVVCLTVSGESSLLLPESVPVVELRKPSGNSMRFLLQLARRIQDLQPAVVQTYNWSGMDGIIAARLAGCSVVHSEHGWDIVDPYGLSIKRILIRRVLSPWVAHYTCVSRQMERCL